MFGRISLKLSEFLISTLKKVCSIAWLLFDMNPEKSVILFGGNSLKVSDLVDMNTEKKYVVLFGSNSLKVSEWLDMNAEKSFI